MGVRSLNRFRGLRNMLIAFKRSYLVWVKGAKIDPTVSLSLSSEWLLGERGAISVGACTLIAFKTCITALDETGRVAPVFIGRDCFIGGGAMILPGVSIGDGSIVGAGAVVMADVPPKSMVVGNPARVVRSNIQAGPYGRLPEADANTARLWDDS